VSWRSFSSLTQLVSNNHFSIFHLNLICLTSVGLPTIRTGILPIRMTDYRYLVIFLHGSTCWLGYDLVPIIQLEKLSSQTRLTKLRLETIGGTWLKCFSYWSPTYLPDGQGRRGFNNLGYSRTSVHASIDSSTWFGLFCEFLSVLIGRLYFIMDQLKISPIWHQVCIKTTSGQLSRGLSLLSRGLSCAVGLRNYAVFPSSFPCLWEAREGLGGGSTLFGHLFRLLGGNWHLETSNTIWFCIEMEGFHSLCLPCGVVAHYLWQGEKICLSPYLYHLMWC
jgi:hypothetical protein